MGWLASGELYPSYMAEQVTEAYERIAQSPYFQQVGFDLSVTARAPTKNGGEIIVTFDPTNDAGTRVLCALGHFADNGFMGSLEQFYPSPEGPPFIKEFRYDAASDTSTCIIRPAKPADMIGMVDRFFELATGTS